MVCVYRVARHFEGRMRAGANCAYWYQPPRAKHPSFEVSWIQYLWVSDPDTDGQSVFKDSHDEVTIAPTPEGFDVSVNLHQELRQAQYDREQAERERDAILAAMKRAAAMLPAESAREVREIYKQRMGVA